MSDPIRFFRARGIRVVARPLIAAPVREGDRGVRRDNLLQLQWKAFAAIANGRDKSCLILHNIPDLYCVSRHISIEHSILNFGFFVIQSEYRLRRIVIAYAKVSTQKEVG